MVLLLINDLNTHFCGGCTCGAVRYKAIGKPSFAFICQCTQCQKITGAGNAPGIAFENENFKLEGKLSYYSQQADDGNTINNGFCPTCGNPILKTTSASPDRIYLHVGSLDDPAKFKPDFVVFSDSGHAWDRVDPNLKRY